MAFGTNKSSNKASKKEEKRMVRLSNGNLVKEKTYLSLVKQAEKGKVVMPKLLESQN